jgi:hypothetical protein
MNMIERPRLLFGGRRSTRNSASRTPTSSRLTHAEIVAVPAEVAEVAEALG